MTMHFIDTVGGASFVEHANQTHAVQEIARFYDLELKQSEDLSELLNQVSRSAHHTEIFYYAVYFAAWIKQEIPNY